AMEALVEAKAQGLTKFLGITGHGLQIPSTHLHALSKFDFDSVLFPINPVLWANENYRREATRLLELARQRDVGVMIIKAFCKRPWGERAKSYQTWYEPFDDAVTQEQCLRFALSQNGVTGLCSAGDTRLIENILNAAENFAPMSEIEQTRVVKEFAREYESLFV
ncbi:MAG: aldo/keto reductase, partial [Chloroflexi bacterium]|nr:aldo/keto reductase [Chloroflexota bacterium]